MRRAGGESSSARRPQPNGHGDGEHVDGAVAHPADRNRHMGALRLFGDPATQTPHGDQRNDDRIPFGELCVRDPKRLARPLEGAAHRLDRHALVRCDSVV